MTRSETRDETREGGLDLRALLDELQDPTVRDLAWVIASPGLIDQACALASRVGGAGGAVMSKTLREIFEGDHRRLEVILRSDGYLREALRTLDQDPSPLLSALEVERARHTRVRLGVYVEHLVAYGLSELLKAAPLHREIQLYEPIERNGVVSGNRTVGALDFVGRIPSAPSGDQPESTRENTWVHVEVASKFYLMRPHMRALLGDPSSDPSSGPSSPAHPLDHPWLEALRGPNERDSLGTKLRRLARHQLPLSDHPSARVKLGELGVSEITERVAWIKGRLFTWVGDRITMGSSHQGGEPPLWARLDEPDELTRLERALSLSFGDQRDSTAEPLRVHALHRPKPHWLAPPAQSELKSTSAVTLKELSERARESSGERGASLWYVATQAHHGCWLMFVPQDWCARGVVSAE